MHVFTKVLRTPLRLLFQVELNVDIVTASLLRDPDLHLQYTVRVRLQLGHHFGDHARLDLLETVAEDSISTPVSFGHIGDAPGSFYESAGFALKFDLVGDVFLSFFFGEEDGTDRNRPLLLQSLLLVVILEGEESSLRVWCCAVPIFNSHFECFGLHFLLILLRF